MFPCDVMVLLFCVCRGEDNTEMLERFQAMERSLEENKRLFSHLRKAAVSVQVHAFCLFALICNCLIIFLDHPSCLHPLQRSSSEHVSESESEFENQSNSDSEEDRVSEQEKGVEEKEEDVSDPERSAEKEVEKNAQEENEDSDEQPAPRHPRRVVGEHVRVVSLPLFCLSLVSVSVVCPLSLPPCHRVLCPCRRGTAVAPPSLLAATSSVPAACRRILCPAASSLPAAVAPPSVPAATPSPSVPAAMPSPSVPAALPPFSRPAAASSVPAAVPPPSVPAASSVLSVPVSACCPCCCQ